MIDVYSICLCHFYHGIYNGTGLCTVRSITEQPVFTAYREWADRILAEIIRKAASAIFQIGHKIGPAVLDIGDCLIHPGSPDRFLQVKPRQKALNDRHFFFKACFFERIEGCAFGFNRFFQTEETVYIQDTLHSRLARCV